MLYEEIENWVKAKTTISFYTSDAFNNFKSGTY